jgi:hypothetical protein
VAEAQEYDEMRFLVEAHPHFDHMTATVTQGLRNLGHTVYGMNNNGNSYLTPHRGEAHDVFIQTLPNKPALSRPSILLCGQDAGKGFCVHSGMLEEAGFDLAFVRELVDTRCERAYPINFGIEDRYYCHTIREPLPLAKRHTDITFSGQFDTAERVQYVNMINSEFRKFRRNVGPRKYSNPDQKWSCWVNGFCFHDPAYFRALAMSKINLSFAGWGADCARHWEVMASGGIPVIEKPPYDIPHLTDENCIFFSGVDELRDMLTMLLTSPNAFQGLANQAFADGKLYHTTGARAAFILDKVKEIL